MGYSVTKNRTAGHPFSVFDELFGPLFTQASETNQPWSPRADVVETPEAYELTLELPGLTAEQVDLSFENDTLTLKGTLPAAEVPEEGHELLRRERRTGSFERSFSFPVAVDAQEIVARFENGLLHVSAKKSESAQSRRIQIQS